MPARIQAFIGSCGSQSENVKRGPGFAWHGLCCKDAKSISRSEHHPGKSSRQLGCIAKNAPRTMRIPPASCHMRTLSQRTALRWPLSAIRNASLLEPLTTIIDATGIQRLAGVEMKRPGIAAAADQLEPFFRVKLPPRGKDPLKCRYTFSWHTLTSLCLARFLPVSRQ